MRTWHSWHHHRGLPESAVRRYVAAQHREAISTAKGGLNGVVQDNLSEARRLARYRETVRELSQLSDRKLDDIGVGRNDIEHIVRHSLAADAAA